MYAAWAGGMLQRQEDPVKLAVEAVRGKSYVFGGSRLEWQQERSAGWWRRRHGGDFQGKESSVAMIRSGEEEKIRISNERVAASR